MTGSKTHPIIIDLPGGDAILASKIEKVQIRPAFVDSLGTSWPARVQVNGGEYTCENDDQALTERDRIIGQWKSALTRVVGATR